MYKVISDVGAEKLINRRSMNIDTVIGDRGIQISGGQKQRIILARALLKKPILIVLDEATSALDEYSEDEINKMIKKLIHKYDLTAIVISHKANSIKISDEIFEIKNRKISKLK